VSPDLSSKPPPWLPVLSLLVGASLWGVAWYPLRLLEAAGLSGLSLTFIVYAAALIASLPYTRIGLRELVHAPGLALALMAAAGWTNIAFVLAVLDGNVLRVLLLFYLSPLWAVLLGRWLLHERLSQPARASLALALGGAVIMLWHPEFGLPWPRAGTDWLAISSGFCFALSNVVVRKAERLSLAAKAAGVWIGVAVLAGAILLIWRPPSPAVEFPVILGAVGLGVFGILLMTVMIQYGVTHMPVHRSAVILLFELVAGAASQQLLTDEIVTAREWLGGALIIAGAWLAARATGK
jgi:drug/metabolite transporter (DMT)-like permease